MKIKIFLASSKELENERLVFADLVAHLNNALESRDITINLVKWEYVDASMGPEHKQEEYNKLLKDCDLCIVLYWTSFGKWTKIELDTAYNEKCAGHNPKKLYVYFKDGEEISEELQKFRDGFPENYGHFFSEYKNIDTLKAHFLLQFMDYLSNSIIDPGVIEIQDSKVIINGKPYVELANVPIVGNNEKYNDLLKTIDDKQTILSLIDKTHPKYSEYKQELEKARTELHQIEESIWDTALLITNLSNEKNSKNLQLAIDLLNQGDNKGARALLLNDNDDKEIAHNLKLIRIGEEGIKDIINKKRLLIKTYENDRTDDWVERVISLRKEIVDISKKAFGEESLEYASSLDSLGYTYYIHNNMPLAENSYLEALAIFEGNNMNNTQEYSTLLLHLGDYYMKKEMYYQAEPYYLKALEITKEHVGEKSIIYANALLKMGHFYRIFTLYDKTKECLEKALTIIKESKGDNTLLQVQVLRELALSYADVGNDESDDDCRYSNFSKDKKELYKEAFLLLNEAISHIEKKYGKNNYSYITLQINVSYIYNLLDHFSEAETTLLEALEISKDVNDHHASYDIVLDAIGRFYHHSAPEKAEALGFDYSTAKDIPKIIKCDFEKSIRDYRKRKKNREDELSLRIAKMYLKKHPREEWYAITLINSEWVDNEGTNYYHLEEEEINILKAWKEYPVIDDCECDLHDYLEAKGYNSLIERVVDNNSFFGWGLDTLSDCNMDSPLKYTRFSMQIQEEDGSFKQPYYIWIDLTDEQYLELLAELIKRRNRFSVNMLVYLIPELGQLIMRGLAWEDGQFEIWNPFVCDFYELKKATKSILVPFEDDLQLFESDDEEIRNFAIEHQIVENDNDEIYTERHENDVFIINAYIVGKELVVDQNGHIFKGLWGIDHDQDSFKIDARIAMEKFGLNCVGQLIPYLKKHFASRDGLAQIRKFFVIKE